METRLWWNPLSQIFQTLQSKVDDEDVVQCLLIAWLGGNQLEFFSILNPTCIWSRTMLSRRKIFSVKEEDSWEPIVSKYFSFLLGVNILVLCNHLSKNCSQLFFWTAPLQVKYPSRMLKLWDEWEIPADASFVYQVPQDFSFFVLTSVSVINILESKSSIGTLPILTLFFISKS